MNTIRANKLDYFLSLLIYGIRDNCTPQNLAPRLPLKIKSEPPQNSLHVSIARALRYLRTVDHFPPINVNAD